MIGRLPKYPASIENKKRNIIELGLGDLHAAHVSVYSFIDFWMAEPIFMKLGILVYIMAPDSISMAYVRKLSHQCLYVYPTYRCYVTAR
jgi:hypothetical protein